MVLYPCKEKDCGWCCDPVKVKAGFPMSQIPKDKNGKEIWEKKPEMRIPEAHPDTIRLDIFECLNYNKEEKKCDDYENRPDICRNGGCIDPTSEKSTDEQYTKTIKEKFYKISTGNRGKK